MPSTSSTRRTAARRGNTVNHFLALLLLVFAALPAHADAKKIMMIVPNAMRRTAINMVTFRNHQTAIMQWLDIAATLTDAETTRRSIGRGSTEYNPFLGRHPSGPRAYGMLLTVGFAYATMTQVIQDRVEKPRPFTLGITAMAAFSHAYVSYHNTTICPGNLTCNPPPAN
jgi:hypothetical protein